MGVPYSPTLTLQAWAESTARQRLILFPSSLPRLSAPGRVSIFGSCRRRVRTSSPPTDTWPTPWTFSATPSPVPTRRRSTTCFISLAFSPPCKIASAKRRGGWLVNAEISPGVHKPAHNPCGFPANQCGFFAGQPAICSTVLAQSHPPRYRVSAVISEIARYGLRMRQRRVECHKIRCFREGIRYFGDRFLIHRSLVRIQPVAIAYTERRRIE